MTRGEFESDVTIPGFDYRTHCPHCGGAVQIVMGERLGTVSVPIGSPVLAVPAPGSGEEIKSLNRRPSGGAR